MMEEKAGVNTVKKQNSKKGFENNEHASSDISVKEFRGFGF